MGKNGNGNAVKSTNRGLRNTAETNSLNAIEPQSNVDTVEEIEKSITLTVSELRSVVCTEIVKVIDVFKIELAARLDLIDDSLIEIKTIQTTIVEDLAKRFNGVDSEIRKLHNINQEVEKTLTENKTLLSGHPSTATEKPLKCETSIEDALAEIREQDRKKNNFILFNIPESKSLNGVVRSEDDKNKFISITQSLNVKNNDADISFIRLGKPTAEKMRPLVIKGSSVLKSEMFQKIKNLKDLPVDHEHKK